MQLLRQEVSETITRRLRRPLVTTEQRDMQRRRQLHPVALEWRSAGYRPITKELHRRGAIINKKVVLRLLREDNLLCLRRRAFVSTTDSQHQFATYPNLGRELVLTDINQLWVADITYIRLQQQFIYLAPLHGRTIDPSLRSRGAVCLPRLCARAAATSPSHQHEPHRQPL